MEIKDNKGVVRIRIDDFSKNHYSVSLFTDIRLCVFLDMASVSDVITIEISDISELIENLNILYNDFKYIFYFTHIDSRFEMKFEADCAGLISIRGFMKDVDYVNSINFSFIMEYSYLPTLIRQAEEDLSILK